MQALIFFMCSHFLFFFFFCSCGFLQSDQCYLRCCLRVLHRTNLSNNVGRSQVSVKYCGKFVRQKLQPSWQCFVLYGAQAASASALFVQLSLHPLPHSFYVQYPPSLFSLAHWTQPISKLRGLFGY